MQRDEMSLLSLVRNRKELTIEIIVIALTLGILVNIASSALYDTINNNQWKLPLLITIPFIVALIIVAYYLKKPIAETTEFRILMPLVSVNDKPLITDIAGYATTEHASRLLNNAVRNGMCIGWGFENAEEIITDDVSSARIRVLMEQLIIALILRVVREYGNRSLTTSVNYYQNFRHMAGKFSSKNVTNAELLQLFPDNIFVLSGIRLPDSIGLNKLSRADNVDHNGISFGSKNVRLEVELLRHWMQVRKHSNRKTYHIVTMRASPKPSVILSIPISCRLIIEPRQVFSRKTDADFEWIAGLRTELYNWLSWDQFAESYNDRLLVEIYKTLAEIRNNSVSNAHTDDA